MFRGQASVRGDQFESASIHLQRHALTNHIQGHNKAKAIAFFQDDTNHAGQGARHDAYLVPFGHEWVGFNCLTGNDAPEQFHIAIRNHDRPRGIADGA